MIGARFPTVQMVQQPPPRSTVVLVDDDAALREALRFSLEIDGFDVETFASGEALLEFELPAHTACLVLDLHLGGVSGIEVLERLRNRGVEIPAIMITSAPDPGLRARTLLCDARLVEKPLLSDGLTNAIRALT